MNVWYKTFVVFPRSPAYYLTRRHYWTYQGNQKCWSYWKLALMWWIDWDQTTKNGGNDERDSAGCKDQEMKWQIVDDSTTKASSLSWWEKLSSLYQMLLSLQSLNLRVSRWSLSNIRLGNSCPASQEGPSLPKAYLSAYELHAVGTCGSATNFIVKKTEVFGLCFGRNKKLAWVSSYPMIPKMTFNRIEMLVLIRRYQNSSTIRHHTLK